jgi:uncharacterized protein YdeI (YjbR/CyaY-like superfamily)
MSKIVVTEFLSLDGVSDLLYISRREEWRAWLQQHYKTDREIWLVYYKQHTGKPRISYNDAVEEALCFGWIDSTARGIDEDRYAQKFSVRNPKSSYSQANIERLRALIEQGLVADEVRISIGDLLEREFVIPQDILKAIHSDPLAWQNFQSFSPSYTRIRIAFIDGARNRPQEFAKRLDYFIRKTAQNKKFGFGGIEKYY